MEDGSWTFLDDIEALVVPPDLAAALEGVREVWQAWPLSGRKRLLTEIKLAKTPATRARRIAKVVVMAEQGEKP